MAKSLETIDTSLDPSRPVTTPNDVRENQRPLQISLPCPNDTQPEADDSDNTTDRDDFLSWDPWGDDSERYPEGFWNQIVDLPGIAQTSSSDSNERLSEIDMASITSGSTTCTSGDEPIAISHESVKEETTVSDPEDATKKAVDEEKAAEKDVEKEGSTEAERECTICLESVAKDRFPDLPHTAHSEHSSDVCLTCWEQHLEAEILSKNFEGVSCPLCSQKLLEADVRKLAKRSTYLESV
jgi:DNA-directed RNA polymerase subunit RPC12/RpoP